VISHDEQDNAVNHEKLENHEYCLSLKIFLCGSLRVLCVSAVKVISTAENAETTQRTAERNYRIKTPPGIHPF
jgi:hypothetical protein